MEVGEKGFWIEDDGQYTYCKITEVVDSGAGLCGFEAVDDVSDSWMGFYDEFIQEC